MMIEGRENKKESDGEETVVGTRGRLSRGVFVLRVVALALTVAATVVMGVAKETEIVPIKILPDLPPFNVPAPAKWTYMSALVYFVVSNAIACTYAALSLVLAVATSGVAASGKRGAATVVILAADLLTAALLASSCGAAGAVGLIGYSGNSHVQWHKVCNVFHKFCNHVAAAVLLSLLGAVVFLVLVLLAALNLHRRSV